MGVKAALEQDIVNQCICWLNIHGIAAARLNTGGGRDRYGRPIQSHGFGEGAPDIIGIVPWVVRARVPGCMPTRDHGVFLGVECKKRRPAVHKPTSKITGAILRERAQAAFGNMVRKHGGIYILCWSVQMLEEELRKEGWRSC